MKNCELLLVICSAPCFHQQHFPLLPSACSTPCRHGAVGSLGQSCWDWQPPPGYPALRPQGLDLQPEVQAETGPHPELLPTVLLQLQLGVPVLVEVLLAVAVVQLQLELVLELAWCWSALLQPLFGASLQG